MNEAGGSARPPVSPFRRMTPLDGDATGTHPSTMAQQTQQLTEPSQSIPINQFWTPPLTPPTSQMTTTAITNYSQTSQTPFLNNNNNLHGNQTMAGSHFSSTTPMSHHNYYQNPYATPYPYGYLGGPAQQPDFSVVQQGNAGQGQNPATTGAQFTQQSTNVPPPYIPAYVLPPTGAQQRYANPAAPETSNIQFGSFPPYNPYAFANPAQTYPLADNSDTDEPFVKELHEYEMPATAKLPHLKVYDGTTCPDSHIDMYKWQMQSLRLDKRFWCTHFPTTLYGNAGLWFKSLAPRSIRSFAELKQLFLTNFMQLRKYRGDVREIIGCRQMEG